MGVMSAKDIKRRVDERRKALGLSARALSLAAGLGPDGVRNINRAIQRGGNVNVSTIEALAAALNITADQLIGDQPKESAMLVPISGVKFVPVMGEVRAGAFMSVVELVEPEEWIPYANPQYDHVELFALRVVGRSMDMEYPSGTIVICASVFDTEVQEHDHVILRRQNSLGLVETTLKQVVMNNGVIEFWPRSTDPKFQEPFRAPIPAANSDETWEVTGIVVSSVKNSAPRSGRSIGLK